MELDSDEEIDEKLDRAYENSRKQTSLKDILTEANEPMLKSGLAAIGTPPPMDTLSLLKAIADTGTLISPALKTQLELIHQNKPSVLQTSNPNFLSTPEDTQLNSSMEEKLNRLIEQKAAFTSLQNQGLLSHPSFSHNPIIPILKSEHAVTQYADTLISPNVYKSSQPASGQSTPLLDEAPDTEDKKQTPDQYNQFASYTQGLYKPIESSPIDNNITKETPFRDYYTPNETKKPRMDSPMTLNLKVIDYKHGASVRPAASIPPPPPITPYNEAPDPRISQQMPFENTHPINPTQLQNQPTPTPPYPSPRPMMNPQHNIQMAPPHILNQPPLPFQRPDNNMPPYRMADNKTGHELNMNNQSMPPAPVHELRKGNEQRPAFHGQQPPPRPPPPHFFRPPPPHFAPPGNRPMAPYDFRMPPPNDLPHRYPPPHPPSYSHNTRPRNFQGHNRHNH